MTSTPPTLQDAATHAADATLQARISMAAALAAQNIASEAPDTPNHTARTWLATQVARQSAFYTMAFTTLLCAEGITPASADADISNMVAAVWNTVAGVSA